MSDDKAIRAAKLTLGGMLEKKRAKEAKDRAGGQIAPSKYLPDVPRQAHADGGRVYPLDDRSGWYGDANYEQTGGKMVMMSPDEYLSKVRPLDIDEASRDNIDDLKQHILSGRKLDPLKIDAQGREDGRHRAHAARELGIKQVPVLTWPRAERASGGYVPAATLPVPRRLAVAAPLQPASAQPSALEALAGLAGTASKIGDTTTGLFGRQEEQHHPNDGHDHGAAPAVARSADNGGMSEAALAAWSGLTDAWGQPLTVTSAYRDPKRNEEVGGANNSQHMHGNAYDVDTSHLSHEERLRLADAAWNAGFRGVGFYDNSMHFDVADPRAWGPSYSRDSIPDWAQGWTSQRYGYADGGEVTDLGQVREQKQLQGFHKGLMGDIHTRMINAMDAHQKAVDAGVFDGYEVGDVLKGSAHPMRITGRFMRKWKPTPMTLRSFERMGAKPTIVEHEGEQYIPMLRYETGVEGEDGWQRGDAYLDGVKAAGYQKMGGLRAVKADGGSVDDLPPVGWNRNGVPEDDAVASPLRRAEYPYMAMVPARQVHAEPLRQAINKAHAEAKVMDLPIDQIVTDVSAIGRSRVKNPAGGLPFVERINGVHHLRDGNHRVAAAWLRGDKTVRALVADMDEAIKANGYADGGSVADRSPMFEGMHEDLRDETGRPLDLWHGTPVEGGFDAFDDEKIGESTDPGFFGRGHYLTPDQKLAGEYAGPEDQGMIMGPLHAALKNPFMWDVSNEDKAYRTKAALKEMGIDRTGGLMAAASSLTPYEVDDFMKEATQRGHDGVIVKTPKGVTEIVVFNPNMIKHRDAEVGDPNDPRIMRATGGKVDLYSKAAKIIRGLKDQPMPVEDIIKYARANGVKQAEIDYTDPPRGGKARPEQVAKHLEDMQPQIGVLRRGEEKPFTYNSDSAYETNINRLHARGRHDEAERLMEEWEEFAGYGGAEKPRYAQYQLPGGENYREHILTLENHTGPTYTAPIHWSDTPNPLAHIRMSDRMMGNKKILHIEEMQSDWNNDARKIGFRTGREQQDYDDFVAQMRQKAKDMIDATPMVKKTLEKKYDEMDPYTLALKLGVQDQHNQLARAVNEKTMAPPRAPYINPDRDDWAELAMKHILTEAAKGGYDGITFTPDAAQSQRWGGTNFNGIYDKKLPGMAQRLIRQYHDPTMQPDQVGLPGTTTPSALIPLSETARSSIMKNGFSSFRRGGYVTHVRRAR